MLLSETSEPAGDILVLCENVLIEKFIVVMCRSYHTTEVIEEKIHLQVDSILFYEPIYCTLYNSRNNGQVIVISIHSGKSMCVMVLNQYCR